MIAPMFFVSFDEKFSFCFVHQKEQRFLNSARFF